MIKRYFVYICLSLIGFFNFVMADLLDNAFQSSLDQTVVKDATPETYVSNLTSTALKIIVAVGVVMFLLGGVRFIMSMGNDGDMKKQRHNIIMTAIGLVIALASVAIVVLINSITKTTINL